MPSEPARADAPAILVENVFKTYALEEAPSGRLRRMLEARRRHQPPRVQALRAVSFAVGRGETVGILGRNGAGKSTLLRIVCGITVPDNGSVTINGTLSPVLGVQAGFKPELTGRENAVLKAATHGMNNEEIEERLPWIIDFAEIGEFLDRPLRTYSTGMRARLAFAVTFSFQPDVLVIDESIAGLASQALGDGVAQVSRGTRLVFRLPFVNRLLPGTYFIDCAVEGEVAGNRLVLQRITDAWCARRRWTASRRAR